MGVLIIHVMSDYHPRCQTAMTKSYEDDECALRVANLLERKGQGIHCRGTRAPWLLGLEIDAFVRLWDLVLDRNARLVGDSFVTQDECHLHERLSPRPELACTHSGARSLAVGRGNHFLNIA